jgi:hypothetical protein
MLLCRHTGFDLLTLFSSGMKADPAGARGQL